mmetsp:Transcript_11097/g.14491  ORF Transcript_11097/g.14491 Transcript_11097/m.14491 type:complete len:389 (+) Transcript_11097:436-1602(+)
MFGVAECLRDHGLHEDCIAAGSSSGVFGATGLTLGGSFKAAMEFCKDTLIPECRKDLAGIFKISSYVDRCLDISTDFTNYEEVAGRLFVQVTRVPSMEPILLSSFKSGEDLKTSLIASCAMFPLSNFIRRQDNYLYADGGWTNPQPKFSDRTITISPLYFIKADIKPSRYIPLLWGILPPRNPSTIDWLFDLGYVDCLQWMEKNGYTCSHGNKKDNGILSCSKRIQRAPHPYDEHQKCSFQRFLGYGQRNRLMDIIFMFFVLCFWKPVVILLVWVELVGIALFNAFKAALKDMLPVTPILLPGVFMFSSEFLNVTSFVVATFIAKVLTFGSAGVQDWRKTFECMVAACNTSLWIRSLPLIGGIVHVPLYSQQTLEHQSLIYRIAMHFI